MAFYELDYKIYGNYIHADDSCNETEMFEHIFMEGDSNTGEDATYSSIGGNNIILETFDIYKPYLDENTREPIETMQIFLQSYVSSAYVYNKTMMLTIDTWKRI